MASYICGPLFRIFGGRVVDARRVQYYPFAASKKMKQSTSVGLVLLGSAVGLYYYDGGAQKLQQQRYASLEQCVHDWGDPANCSHSAGTVPQPGYYFGPRYYWDASSGRPIAVAGDGSTRSIGNARITSAGSLEGGITTRAGSFSRGGFGSSGHAFGASG
jgi:uncharacterized protein YgiB involved in biofilm formation